MLVIHGLDDHADHTRRVADAPPSWSPAPTCSRSPTWATTCPEPLWPLRDRGDPRSPGVRRRRSRRGRRRWRCMSGPLTGYRIIEIAGIGPGPFAAMLLADMGAEVIRVERAGVGARAGARHAAPRHLAAWSSQHRDRPQAPRRRRRPARPRRACRCADRGLPSRRDGAARASAPTSASPATRSWCSAG